MRSLHYTLRDAEKFPDEGILSYCCGGISDGDICYRSGFFDSDGCFHPAAAGEFWIYHPDIHFAGHRRAVEYLEDRHDEGEAGTGDRE